MKKQVYIDFRHNLWPICCHFCLPPFFTSHVMGHHFMPYFFPRRIASERLQPSPSATDHSAPSRVNEVQFLCLQLFGKFRNFKNLYLSRNKCQLRSSMSSVTFQTLNRSFKFVMCNSVTKKKTFTVYRRHLKVPWYVINHLLYFAINLRPKNNQSYVALKSPKMHFMT